MAKVLVRRDHVITDRYPQYASLAGMKPLIIAIQALLHLFFEAAVQ
jgi:hypothetical protein